MRDVFRFIQCAQDKEAMSALTNREAERFQVMEEDTFDVITALTGSTELETVKDSCMEEGGKIDMCRAIKEMIADGKMEGRVEGRVEGSLEGSRHKAQIVAKNMFLRGMSAEDAAAICEEDLELVRGWYRRWSK